MSLVTAALLTGVLLVPASPAPRPERPTLLALNPQPEPPGRGKIKRIYSGGPDSRRGKTIKQNKTINQKSLQPISPATKY